jgi:hypothetical protein
MGAGAARCGRPPGARPAGGRSRWESGRPDPDRSLSPRRHRRGALGRREVAAIADRLRDAVVAVDATVTTISIVAAWAMRPA